MQTKFLRLFSKFVSSTHLSIKPTCVNKNHSLAFNQTCSKDQVLPSYVLISWRKLHILVNKSGLLLINYQNFSMIWLKVKQQNRRHARRSYTQLNERTNVQISMRCSYPGPVWIGERAYQFCVVVFLHLDNITH
jgi:hypothetical protein